MCRKSRQEVALAVGWRRCVCFESFAAFAVRLLAGTAFSSAEGQVEERIAGGRPCGRNWPHRPVTCSGTRGPRAAVLCSVVTVWKFLVILPL